MAAVLPAGAVLAQERPKPPAPGSAHKARPNSPVQVPDSVELIKDVEFGKGGNRPLKTTVEFISRIARKTSGPSMTGITTSRSTKSMA